MRSRLQGVRPSAIFIVALLIVQSVLALLGGDTSSGVATGLALRGLALALTVGLALTLVRDRRQVARRARALASLHRLAAAPGGSTPLQPLVALARELIPAAARCTIHLTDAQGRLQYAQVAAGAAAARAHAAASSDAAPVAPPPLAQRAAQERRSLRASDLAPGAALASGQAEEASTPVLAVPLCPGEEPLGVLVVYAPVDRPLNAEDETSATLLALVAGLALREQRLRDALQSATPHGELILDTLTDALVVLDHEDRVLLHNPALAAILGPDLAGLQGARLQVRSGDQRIQRLAYLVGDTTPQTPVRRHLTIDEPIHAVLDVETVPVRDPAGRWLRVVTMRDVTHTSDALDAQTQLLRATAHGLQAPLAALSTGPANQGLALPARQLERLRQDLLAVAEPMENLTQSAVPTVTWELVLERLKEDLPRDILRRLQVHSHPALNGQRVPDRWLDHLLLTLTEEAGRSTEGTLSLDVEGRPGEMVFSVRAAPGDAPTEDAANSLGFGASQTTLSLHVAHRLAEALGGYLWQAQDAGALRYQLILPTARRHR